MALKVRTLVKGKLYLRERDIEQIADPDLFVRAFRVRSFNEMTCRTCPHLEERFTKEFCFPCEAYNGKLELAENVRVDGKNYISLPLGAQQSAEKVLDASLKIVNDLRVFPKMSKKYKVTIDLYDGTPAEDGTTRINQQKTVKDWLAGGGIGVIEAGARSGKTVIAVAISVACGLKTLVVTDTSDLLKQFQDTYSGDGKQRVRATNIPKERVVIIKKMEDFLKPHDVALITYQKFIRDTADARIEYFIKNNYGLLIGDEIHGAAAQSYAGFLLKLTIPYRLGLSATTRRKDGRYHIAEAIYGPTIIRLSKVGLKPLIKIHKTGLFAGKNQRAWHLLSKMWVTSVERNKQIVDLAYKAIESGHKAVLIPLDQTEHIDTIVEMLNARAYEEHRKNRNLPEITAMHIDGRLVGKLRDEKFAQFDAPDSEFKFLVAQRKLVKQGIDLKRPSCVICPIPMSATFKDGSPMTEQLAYRGSTPVNNKCQPEVILMVDNMTFTEKMINNLLKWEILKNAVERVGEKRGLYFIDDSCHKFMQNTGIDNVAEGRLGKVVIRR